MKYFVKIFEKNDKDLLEREINKFLKHNKLINVSYTITLDELNNTKIYSALIYYESKFEQF